MRSPARLLPAVLACTFALAACGGQPSGDASGGSGSAAADGASEQETATAAPTTGIPDDFPLTAGMGGPADSVPTSRTGTGLRDLELCGTSPLRGLGTRDRMVADNSGGESADTRELVLLGSPEAAALVAQAFVDLPATCDGSAGTGDMRTVTEVLESSFGAAPAATLLQTYTFDGTPGDGATVVHVVPLGSALLVTSSYLAYPQEGLETGVAETVDHLRRTVDAMAVFGDASPSSEPSPEPTATQDGDAAGVTRVPDDFPLAVGLPEDDGETTVSPPSADGEGMGVVEMCGQEVWPLGDTAGGSRRLVTGALGPEYFDGRELIVHPDAEVASKAMAVLRSATERCRTVDNQVWTVLDRDTGYDTVTVGLTYDTGLGSSVFQVTRVGSARLMVQTYGEGSLAWLDEQADGVTGTTEQIVPAMCVFTRTGC